MTYTNNSYLAKAASAPKAVASLRSEIASGAASLSSERLDSLVNDLARMEAIATLWQRAESVAERDEVESLQDAVRLMRPGVLRSVVIKGADDSWSGRSNDLRRCAFEGTLAWLDSTDEMDGL